MFAKQKVDPMLLIRSLYWIQLVPNRPHKNVEFENQFNIGKSYKNCIMYTVKT